MHSRRLFNWCRRSVARFSNRIALGVGYPSEIAEAGRVLRHLFILGFWRSGTTLLHNYIALNHTFGFPTSWDCFNPQLAIFGVRPPRKDQEILRPMDGMPIRTLSPQEDEFALERLGVATVYRCFASGKLDEPLVRGAMTPETLTENQRVDLQRAVLAFVGSISAREGRPLVLKSPPHLFRLGMLFEWLPNANFILITRSAKECVLSTFRMFETMMHAYGDSTQLDRDRLAQFILKSYAVAQEGIAFARAQLTPDRLQEVSFEGLIRDAEAAISTASERLAIRWARDDLIALREKCRYESARIPTTGVPRDNLEDMLVERAMGISTKQ